MNAKDVLNIVNARAAELCCQIAARADRNSWYFGGRKINDQALYI